MAVFRYWRSRRIDGLYRSRRRCFCVYCNCEGLAHFIPALCRRQDLVPCLLSFRGIRRHRHFFLLLSAMAFSMVSVTALLMLSVAFLLMILFASSANAQAPAPAPMADGTAIDQGIACVLLFLALALTYLIHPLDAFPYNLF